MVPVSPPVVSAVSPPPAVVVSEVAWVGSSSSTSDEWLELYNTSEDLIDLAGWSLWNSAKQQPELLVAIEDGQIASGGMFLIANNGPRHIFSGGESVLAVEPDLITNGMAISNSSLELELRNHLGEVVDVVGDGGPGFLRDATVVRSMERILTPVGSGGLPGSWALAEKSEGLDPGVADQATPTASGRPALVAPTACQLMIGQPAAPIELDIVDPDDVLTINAVGATSDGINLEAMYDPLFRKVSIDLSQLAVAGPFELTVAVSEPSGLSRTVRMPCQAYNPKGAVQIDEVFPAPGPGEREFIELINVGNDSVNLFGWEIDDQDAVGSEAYRISYPVSIEPGGRTVFWLEETELALNNPGDDIQLLRPSGERADLVRYSRGRVDMSWNRGTPWYWSTPSPGRANHDPIPTSVASQGGSPGEPTDMPPILPLAGIVGDQQLLAGSRVRTEGVIMTVYGEYEERRIILATLDAAIEIQLPKGTTWELQPGTSVRLVGTVSSSAEPRLILRSLADLENMGMVEQPVRALDEVESIALFQMVQGVGEVRLAGNTPTIQTERYVVRLTRRRGIALPEIALGDMVNFRGVVVQTEPLTVRAIRDGDIAAERMASEDTVVPIEPVKDSGTESHVTSQVLDRDAPQLASAGERSIPTPVQKRRLFGLSLALQSQIRISNQLAEQVLGAQVASSHRSVPRMSIITALVASLGFLALWGDLLWRYVQRRLQES